MCIFEYDEQEHMDVVREETIIEMVEKLLKDGSLPEQKIMEITGVGKELIEEIKLTNKI